ncbi:MAG: type II toxin-antitoxin system VapC family toxin [Gemmataceae bacterium]
MAGLVLDTHATIWYLEGSPRLSPTALAAIRTALATGDPVYVSTVTIVELTYLVEKGRFPVVLLDQLLVELHRPNPELIVTPLDLTMAELMRSVAATIVRDMPDRMIVATAVTLSLPLVTRDRQIQACGIPVIW